MKLSVKEMTIFGVLGAIMYISKRMLEFAPNIHLLGVFTIAITVVYRKKALYPIYVYVLINGLMEGFSMWWFPYLYIWTILWGVTMLLPKNMPTKIKPIVYMCVCALHGFAYGTLYAPAQAIMFGYDFNTTVKWIIAGLPYDITHGVSNFSFGILIVPIILVLKRMKNLSEQ